MRRITITLLTGLLSAGFAWSAAALSVDPNPIAFSGLGVSGFTTVSIGCEASGGSGCNMTGLADSTLTFQTSVTDGKVARQRVLVEDSGSSVRAPLDYGKIGGPDVNIKRIRLKSDGSVEFSFKKSFFHQHVHAGQTSDKFWVSYGDLAAGDVITLSGYRYQIFGSFGSEQATIVPEPSTTLLVLLGVAGLAVAGRRQA